MKCPLVRSSSKTLETAIMPEDVWMKATAEHQQPGPQPQRREGILGSFRRNKADKMRLRQHSCHRPRAEEEKVTTTSSFRRYDWRVEHLPLILKRRTADTQEDDVDDDQTTATFQESFSSLTSSETAAPPPTKKEPILCYRNGRFTLCYMK
jgi:hypothetical protein